MKSGTEAIWRVRSGDYRILYVVRAQEVVVIDIDHRKDVVSMTKKPAEPDEMRMHADQFDEMMRHALGVPSPSEQPKAEPMPKPKTVKRKKDVEA